MTRTRLRGLHHLSAISSHAQDTIDFYAGILGLPLLKQTVNYDDPGRYHLYFGDPDLQMGTMTFFVWPGARRGQIGRGGTSHLAFVLTSEAAFGRWETWLSRHGISTTIEPRPDGAEILRIDDPDGLRLELFYPAREPETDALAATGNVVAAANTPPRLGPIDQVAVVVTDLETSTSFYTDLLGLDVGSWSDDHSPPMTDAGWPRTRSTLPVVLLQANARTPAFQLGAGMTHHFALQVDDAEGLAAWRDFLNDSGVPTTDLKDRRYFQSIYFRDPDGHILEIATSEPGFTVDEQASQLGQRLTLPPWLEDRRSEISRRLPLLNAHPPTRD